MSPSHILGMAPQGRLYLRDHGLYERGIRDRPWITDYIGLSADDARRLLDQGRALPADRGTADPDRTLETQPVADSPGRGTGSPT